MKKGDTSIYVVVFAVLALIVLIILIVIFSSQLSALVHNIWDLIKTTIGMSEKVNIIPNQ